MARETQRRKVGRTEVALQSRDAPRIQEQRRFFSAQGNDSAVRQARALENAFGVLTEAFDKKVDRDNTKGQERAAEQAGAGGSRDPNDKNFAYHRQWDLLDDERSLQAAGKELPDLLSQADAENLTEIQRQELISGYMKAQFDGIDLENEDHTFLAKGLLALETELVAHYRDSDLERIKEGQRSETFAAERENYARMKADGLQPQVRYDVLMERTNTFFDGPEKRIAYREMIYDLAIENGDPSIIVNEPEKFPDGSQTGKNDPGEQKTRRAAIQAATVRQANMVAAQQAEVDARNDDLRFNVQMEIYKRREAGYDVSDQIELLSTIPGTELSDITTAKNFGDSQLDEGDSRSANLPFTTGLWRRIYEGSASMTDVMQANEFGLMGSGPQAKEETRKMMAQIEAVRKSKESLSTQDDTQWRSQINKRFNPQLGGLLAEINPLMNRVNIDANATYIDLRAQGLPPAEAANKVYEKYDAIAKNAPTVDKAELEGVRSQGDFTAKTSVTAEHIKLVAQGKAEARAVFAGVPDYVLTDRILQEVDAGSITQKQAEEIWLNTR